ncbi:hypothetical protein [Clostridium sp. Marseille-Q7071]
MSKSKKINIIIDQEERQLVYHSEFINKYPKLKELLNNKMKVSKKDLINIKNLDKDLYNLIKYNFKNIVKESSKEWSAFKYDGESKKKCSLCNTPNKYIFLIKNKVNNIVLNVGSECRKKFPGIDSIIDGKSIDQIKKDRSKEVRRMLRISEFNDKYPDTIKKFEIWQEYYNELPIIMPKKIHTGFIKLLRDSKEFYNNYIEGKKLKKELNDFSKYIYDYNTLATKIDIIINSNKSKEFICTKSIKDWLLSNNLNGVIELIINDDGYITIKSVRYIYYFPFLERYIYKFQNVFENLNFIIEEFNEDEVVISYKFINNNKVHFRISLKNFMNKYGQIIFEEFSNYVTVSNILENFNIIKSEGNYYNISNIINSEIDKKKYTVTIDLDRNELEVEDKINKKYCSLKAEVFIQSSITCLLERENNESLIQLIEKVQNWKDISEKKKYNIDELEKLMKNM